MRVVDSWGEGLVACQNTNKISPHQANRMKLFIDLSPLDSAMTNIIPLPASFPMDSACRPISNLLRNFY